MKDNVYISSEDIVKYLGRLCKKRTQGINFKDRPVFGMKDITIQQQIWQYSWAEALERRKAHGLRTR